MKRTILVVSIISVILSVFAVSYTYANNTMNDAVNGVRNFVGGAENMVEDAGNAAASTIRNGLNTIENGAGNVGNAVENGARNTGNAIEGAMTDDNNDDGYTVARTATDTTDGINTTTWTWFIIGVTAIAIGVLIWSYIRERNARNSYIDSNDR